MSFVIRTYRCDSGGEAEEHQFEVMLASGEHPKFCPQCGCEVDPEIEPIPAKMSIGGSNIARATEMTYRLVENSSAARARELDAPALKVTDMNDRLREGDVAAKTPLNTVTRFAAEAKAQIGVNYLQWGGGLGGSASGPAIPTGTQGQSYSGPGHVAMRPMQGDHDARVREVVSHPMAPPYVSGR